MCNRVQGLSTPERLQARQSAPVREDACAGENRCGRDLCPSQFGKRQAGVRSLYATLSLRRVPLHCRQAPSSLDRKSTRLNSSHQIISYAVFCLKKKKQKHSHDTGTTKRNLTT